MHECLFFNTIFIIPKSQLNFYLIHYLAIRHMSTLNAKKNSKTKSPSFTAQKEETVLEVGARAFAKAYQRVKKSSKGSHLGQKELERLTIFVALFNGNCTKRRNYEQKRKANWGIRDGREWRY